MIDLPKEPKKLMVPFEYGTEEMMDYCGYNYYDSENNYKAAWDEKNKRLYGYFCKSEDDDNYVEVDAIVWKENYEFIDTLVLDGYSRGRSAANFNLKSKSDGKNYNLFMKDTLHLIQNATVYKGEIHAKWTFVKRGSNYGIQLVGIL